MKNSIITVGASAKRKAFGATATLLGLAASAMAQTGSGNTGADTIITQVEGLAPVAVAVIGAAVLVVVVPWGAKMAIRAFKSIGGA